MIRLPLPPFRARLARVLALLACLTLAAPAAAQTSGPSLAITAVDSEGFPSVTAHLTVTGENGLPLVGLSAANFTVVEDGQAVPAGDVSLESDSSQPLTLVLAVDVAMPAEELLAVQTALRAFTDGLTAQDQVALLTFGEEVTEVQPFTADKVALATAIGGLTPRGNATLFNLAAEAAVSRLSALPAGRKAVLLFTDSGDTTNSLSPEATIDKAQDAGVALYPFAHGTRVNQTIIENWARFTGGQAYLLARPSEIQANLQTLGVLLRQSYRLIFTSGVTADNGRHDLSIVLDYQDQSATADSRFVAVPGEVSIEGLTIANGQTLRGMVFLIAEVSAPAPVESVAFMLDGETLVELTSPPYRFDWDTATAGAGTHAVTVVARDSAGNVGEQQVSVNVAVPAPVAPTAVPAPTAAPAESRLVGLARSALSIGRIALSAAALLAAFVVALLLWLRSRELLAPPPVGGYKLELVNHGNARTQFELRGEDPAKLMKFQFLVNDTSLATRRAAPAAEYSAAAAAQVAPAAGLAPANGHANGKDQAKGKGKEKRKASREQTVLQKGQATLFKASGFSQQVTSWVMAVTYFLPGRTRSLVRAKTATVRDVGFQAHEAGEAPDRYRRMTEHVVDVDAIKEKVSGGKEKAARGQQAAATAEQATTTVATTAVATRPGVAAPAASAVPAVAAAPAQPSLKNMAANTAGWAVTPAVEPGGTLTIRLEIVPQRVPKTQTYGFRVLSRAANNADPNKLTRIEHGSVALTAMAWHKQLVSWLLFVCMVGALAWLVWFLLNTLGVISLA